MPSFIIVGCVWQFLGRGPFCFTPPPLPHLWAAPKFAILNRVNIDIKAKPYVTKNIWQGFSTIRKVKVTLTLNQPAYIGMYILDLRIPLMYEIRYGYIKNENGNDSILLLTDADSLMCEELHVRIITRLILEIIQLSQNIVWWLK